MRPAGETENNQPMKWKKTLPRLKALGDRVLGDNFRGDLLARIKANGTAVAILFGIVGIAGTYGFLRSGDTAAFNQQTEYAAASGRSGSVGALGRIEPASEIIEVGGPSDEIVAVLAVKEGDSVTKDQVLGHFRSYEQRAAESERISAKLKEAVSLLDAETKSGEAAIHEAEVRVTRAVELYPLRIRAQEAKIRRLQAELVNNRDILKARSELRVQEYQSRRSVDDQRSLVRQNEENLQSETEDLNRLKAEMRLEELSANVALQRARADLARAQAAAGVDSIREDLAVAKARAWESNIISPIDGQILKILIRPGTRVGDKPILKMGSIREMHAVAEIYETDIHRVSIGQRAAITSRALPKPLTGKVVKIGQMIFKNDVLRTDPAAKIDARIVEVRILIDDSAAVANLTNLTVDVVIHVDKGGEAGRS